MVSPLHDTILLQRVRRGEVPLYILLYTVAHELDEGERAAVVYAQDAEALTILVLCVGLHLVDCSLSFTLIGEELRPHVVREVIDEEHEVLPSTWRLERHGR